MIASNAAGAGRTVAQGLRAFPLSRGEALRLLAHAMSATREHLLAHPDKLLPPSAWKHFDELVQRRLAGVPLAYLTGTQEFFGLTFEVTPAVLIPRPDTESLVDEVLRVATAETELDVLELGTGSGCIAIALACTRPRWRILATDVSPDALAIAQHNGARLGARVEFRQSDWFDAVSGRFDLVISNPPYIAAADPHLPDLRDEPRTALTDESDGLQALQAIAAGARRHLKRNGYLFQEHGYDQGPVLRAMLLELGYDDVRTCLDAAGRDRVALGCWRASSAPGHDEPAPQPG